MQQATTIPKEKEQDFIGYALLWCATIDHHHEYVPYNSCVCHSLTPPPVARWEETLYYPMFAPKFDTSFIVAEHETFHEGLVAFEEYLVSALPSGTKYGFDKTAPEHEQVSYEGQKVQELIDAFAEPLCTHVSCLSFVLVWLGL